MLELTEPGVGLRAWNYLTGLLLAVVTTPLAAADWSEQQWHEQRSAYDASWAVVPDGNGYLFVVAANTLASPQSRATLRLVVEDVSTGAVWISDSPIALQVDSNQSVLFPDCAMNPSAGRFGSNPVDLFCVSNRDKAVMEIRDREREERFLSQLRAGSALKVMFAGTDGSANVRSFSLRNSGETIAGVLERGAEASADDSER